MKRYFTIANGSAKIDRVKTNKLHAGNVLGWYGRTFSLGLAFFAAKWCMYILG